MAYKTNSKEAIKNIQDYISTLFDPSNYGKDESEFPTFEEKAHFIYQDFITCKYWGTEKEYYRGNEEKAFTDWLAGLPSVIDSADYIYNNYWKCTEILGNILNQTEKERSKYSNQDAMDLMSRLIYREIKKGVEKPLSGYQTIERGCYNG